jgi:exodeoxyribonuclease-5
MKYGMHADKIVVGEKLLVEKPIKGDTREEIIYNTNDDLTILRLEVKTKELHGIKYNYYDAMVQSDEDVNDIHILHETSNKAYTVTLKKLADDAKGEKDSYRRGQKWIKYFEFIENFAQVKYNYAITVHNSQGSTFTNCFAVYTDIVANYNEEERKRILYTAVTRPRELLYIM